MKKETYELVKNPVLAGKVIAEYVRQCIKSGTVVNLIRLAVEDTPSADEWIGADPEEKKHFWEGTTGIYGIRNVAQDFDVYENTTLLVGAYYGGCAIHSAPVVNSQNTDEEIVKAVSDLVTEMLAADDCTGNIIINFSAYA